MDEENLKSKLNKAWLESESLLCVGLDPDPKRLPQGYIPKCNTAIYDFCCDIIDATAPYVCAFKPQIAHFSALFAENELCDLINHIRSKWPNKLVILDAKRGDIPSTAEYYAREAFECYGADAVTVNPYMGLDTIEPYLQYSNKGVFALCVTSNTGAEDFQHQLIGGKPLYYLVAEKIMNKWPDSKSIGLVVGANAPAKIADIRALVGDVPLLVPGIGAQGGNIAEVVSAGKDSNGKGMIINSSRAVLYANSTEKFSEKAGLIVKETRDLINSYLTNSI